MINKITAISPIEFEKDNQLLTNNNIYRPRTLRCNCGNLPQTQITEDNNYEVFCEGCNTFLESNMKFKSHYLWNMLAMDKFHENEHYLKSLDLEFDPYMEEKLEKLIEYKDCKDRDFLSNGEVKTLDAKIAYYTYALKVFKMIKNIL